MLDPAMRASDSERESVAGIVRNAAADGRLDQAEADERLAAIARSRTYGDLDDLVRDLTPVLPTEFLDPAPERAPAESTGGTSTSGPQRVEPGYAPEDPLVIDPGWSSVKRQGRWTVPPYVTLKGAAGTIHLDCTEAVAATPVINVEVRGGVGSMTMVLPEGWGVDASRVTRSMGTLTLKVQESGSPLVQLFGRMTMGTLTIRHRNWWERRRARREQQNEITSSTDPERRELR